MSPSRMLGLALLAPLFVATSSDARPKITKASMASAPSTFILSAAPHVPLAVVTGGRVLSAVDDASKRKQRCGSPDRWAKVGSRWHAVDTWGQIVGTHTVVAKDPYDVTGCAELTFAPKRANDDALVYISADSSWQPRPSTRWLPTAPQKASFTAMLDKYAPAPTAAVPASIVPSQCKSIREQVLYFDAPGRGRFAVGGTNAGYIIASLGQGNTWDVVEAKQSPVLIGTATECYRPVAVFDMNDDGVPEIVLRASSGDGWSEIVFELGAKGGVTVVASSPGGSTA